VKNEFRFVEDLGKLEQEVLMDLFGSIIENKHKTQERKETRNEKSTGSSLNKSRNLE